MANKTAITRQYDIRNSEVVRPREIVIISAMIINVMLVLNLGGVHLTIAQWRTRGEWNMTMASTGWTHWPPNNFTSAFTTLSRITPMKRLFVGQLRMRMEEQF
jgi:hypothetical protein